MAEARSRFRSRMWGARALTVAYVFVLAAFWIEGSRAYLHMFDGSGRFLGLVYFPILFLPLIGRGTIDGLAIHGGIWLWLFALQMFFGTAAVFTYPSQRRSWQVPVHPHAIGRGDSAAVAPTPRT